VPRLNTPPIGHSTNLASRLQTIVRSGAIVVSEHTRKLVEGYVVLKSLGSSRANGIAEPVNVYEVTRRGPLRTRLQAPGRGFQSTSHASGRRNRGS